MKKAGLLLLLALLLTGCAGREGEIVHRSPAEKDEGDGMRNTVWEGKVTVQPEEPGGLLPLENTLFEILAQNSTDANLLISPYSMKMLMTMVYHSSEGEAREELEQFLEIKGSEEEVYEERSVIRRQLQKERKGIRLMCAESFWIERPEDRDLGDLTEKLKEYYGCEVYPVKKFDEEIRQQINHWASEKTAGMIPELMGYLDEELALLLVDTLYFEGTWQTVFEPRDSHEGPFFGYGAGSNPTVVTYMAQKDVSYAYAGSETVRALELPYGKEGEIVMDLFVAADGGNLESAELFRDNGVQLKELLAALDRNEKRTFAEISLPKWSESCEIEGLEKIFLQSGLEKVFEPGGMSKIGPGAGISRILQKTAIEVTEHGTKAAAASAAAVTDSAAPDPETCFHVNHNFAYVIRERTSGEILFAGIVNQLGE